MRAPDCSELSRRLGEPLDGSAPEEEGFLVLEQPGPWGRDALRDSPLAPDLAERIAERAAGAGLRVQVIRRTKRRYKPATRTAYLSCVLPGRRFLERLELRDPAELMDLPLDGVARGEPTGAGALEDDLLLLACTHGTRDPCCAKNGLPLHRALSAAAPARVWHSSHLGGHRFAPTMACLPLGIWLGRLPAARARDVVAGLRGGRLPLEHVRGRAGLPAGAQAAELALRRRLGLTRDDAVSCRGAGDGTVRLDTPEGASWIAHVTLAPTGRERPLSCGVGARMEDPGAFRVVLEPAAAG